MDARNPNGAKPEPEKNGTSVLRRRLAEQAGPEQEATLPGRIPEQQRDRLARLAAAETEEFSEPRMSERLADSIAPVADRASAALGRARQATESTVERALRAMGGAIATALRGVLRAVATAVRAVGAALAAAPRFLALVLLRALRAIGLLLSRGLRGLGLMMAGAVRGLGSLVAALPALASGAATGLGGLARGKADGLPASQLKPRDLLLAFKRLAMERPKLLVACALWLAMIGYGVQVYSEHGTVLSAFTREKTDVANEALEDTGARLHRIAETVGLADMPEPEPPRIKQPAVTSEPEQYVLRVETIPAGATVSAAGQSVRAPGELILERPEKTLRVRISNPPFRTAWRRVKPEEFQAEGRVMQHALKVRLQRGGQKHADKAEEKRAAADKRPTIWLEPMPARPKASGASKPAGGKEPVVKGPASSDRPTVWLEPVPSRP
jgi:hypothetical protein